MAHLAEWAGMEILIIAGMLLGMAGGIYGLHRLGVYLEHRGLTQYWKSGPATGGGYNPLQELVLPQARHVVQVQEQRVKNQNEGDPPDRTTQMES